MPERAESADALARGLVDAADRVAALRAGDSPQADVLSSTAATVLYLAAALLRGNAQAPAAETVTLLRVAVDTVFCEATGIEPVNDEHDVAASLHALLRDWSLTLRRELPPGGASAGVTSGRRVLLGDQGWNDFLGALAQFREETRRLRASGGGEPAAGA